MVGSTTSSSVSANAIPCRMPPSTWLDAVSGLTIRPTSWTATIRSTRTSPSAGSTATCAIWQPKVCTTKPSGLGPREPEPSIVASPSFPVTSVTSTSIAPSRERIRPSRTSRSPAAISKTSPASWSRVLRTLAAADRTAGITDGVVWSHPGVVWSHPRPGRRRSAACRRRTRARGRAEARAPRPRRSAPPVSVPVPMSWIPVTTDACPSASSRTVACDGGPPPPHQICVAQPIPRRSPSPRGARSSSRPAQPASSAARS